MIFVQKAAIENAIRLMQNGLHIPKDLLQQLRIIAETEIARPVWKADLDLARQLLDKLEELHRLEALTGWASIKMRFAAFIRRRFLKRSGQLTAENLYGEINNIRDLLSEV